MLVDFAKMDVSYPCFYYECARILLKRTSGIDEKCKEAIIAAVKRIADRDLALWERWVQRKEHNTNWQQLLFSVLSRRLHWNIRTFISCSIYAAFGKHRFYFALCA